MRTLDGLQMATWLCTHMAQRALCLLKAQCWHLVKSHKPDEIMEGGKKVEKRSKSALGSPCLKQHSSQARVLKFETNCRSASVGLNVLHF